MARDYSKILEEQNKFYDPQKNKATQAINKKFDSLNQNITDNFTQQIEESEYDYEQMQRENAVDKKLNEYYIAEDMANMGLTDSGLSRTQITANQLSHSNKKAEIDRQRQSFVDKLTLEMRSYIAQNEIDRNSEITETEDYYKQLASQSASSIYDTEVTADTDRYKAEQERLAAIEKAAISAKTKSKEKEIEAAEKDSAVDYSSIKTFQKSLVDESEFKTVIDSRENQRGITYDKKLYKNYKTYIKEQLKEHYSVFKTINRGTLEYLLDYYDIE